MNRKVINNKSLYTKALKESNKHFHFEIGEKIVLVYDTSLEPLVQKISKALKD